MDVERERGAPSMRANVRAGSQLCSLCGGGGGPWARYTRSGTTKPSGSRCGYHGLAVPLPCLPKIASTASWH